MSWDVSLSNLICRRSVFPEVLCAARMLYAIVFFAASCGVTSLPVFAATASFLPQSLFHSVNRLPCHIISACFVLLLSCYKYIEMSEFRHFLTKLLFHIFHMIRYHHSNLECQCIIKYTNIQSSLLLNLLQTVHQCISMHIQAPCRL